MCSKWRAVEILAPRESRTSMSWAVAYDESSDLNESRAGIAAKRRKRIAPMMTPGPFRVNMVTPRW